MSDPLRLPWCESTAPAHPERCRAHSRPLVVCEDEAAALSAVSVPTPLDPIGLAAIDRVVTWAMNAAAPGSVLALEAEVAASYLRSLAASQPVPAAVL